MNFVYIFWGSSGVVCNEDNLPGPPARAILPRGRCAGGCFRQVDVERSASDRLLRIRVGGRETRRNLRGARPHDSQREKKGEPEMSIRAHTRALVLTCLGLPVHLSVYTHYLTCSETRRFCVAMRTSPHHCNYDLGSNDHVNTRKQRMTQRAALVGNAMDVHEHFRWIETATA